jgi:hypothetical protein
LHEIVPHTYGAQDDVVPDEHVPKPSQYPPVVAISPTHVAVPHDVDTGANPPQEVALVPSHCAAHDPDPAHAARAPCGGPDVTVAHVPKLVGRSHAWH